MKPVITMYVEAACAICTRARRTLSECRELLTIADVHVIDVLAEPNKVPDNFVGVPTTLLNGRVVALGTPDCAELVSVVKASVLERSER